MRPTFYATKRLTINPPVGTERNIAKHVEWLSDPEVVRFSEQRHFKHSLATQFSFINSFRFPNRFLEISLDKELIGTMTVYVDEPNKVANVGILIGDKTQWNKGYGFEAWSAVCNYLLENGVRKIEAGCREDNQAMKYIFIKSGMFYEAYIGSHFLLEDGSTVGKLLYGRFANGKAD